MKKHLNSLIAGLALAACGGLAIAYFWNRTPPAEPAPDRPPPRAIDPGEMDNTRRAVGVPHRVAQSLQIEGPMSAQQFEVLSADAYVTVHIAQVYVSTLTEKSRDVIVERREVESSGFLVLSLEMTEHSLQKVLAAAERYGVALAPGLYKIPTLAAARLARHLGDEAMERWIEGKGIEEVERMAREMGLEPDASIEKVTRFPESLEGMAGQTYILTYRAGQPPTVELEGGGEMPDEVRHFLERTSFFLDARFYENRDRESFETPAEALHQYLFTSFLPEGGLLAVDGQLTARPNPRPIQRVGDEPMIEFGIEGRIEVAVPGEGTSTIGLSIDPETSHALLGAESGYLRRVEVAGGGEFAHRTLFDILGVDLTTRRSASGEARITARQRCDPIER